MWLCASQSQKISENDGFSICPQPNNKPFTISCTMYNVMVQHHPGCHIFMWQSFSCLYSHYLICTTSPNLVWHLISHTGLHLLSPLSHPNKKLSEISHSFIVTSPALTIAYCDIFCTALFLNVNLPYLTPSFLLFSCKRLGFGNKILLMLIVLHITT